MKVKGLNGATIEDAWKEKIYSYGGIRGGRRDMSQTRGLAAILAADVAGCSIWRVGQLE